jgi:hypothetical protein
MIRAGLALLFDIPLGVENFTLDFQLPNLSRLAVD